MLYNLIVILTGLISSILLFYNFPVIKKSDAPFLKNKISVVIPARNEEDNLPLLLRDLKHQIVKPYEIICVDDCSTDNTARAAESFKIKLLTLNSKPEEWTGKAWACQKGAEAASGDILLFLDADVRLSRYAISSLINEYNENKCVISVQPYHKTIKSYEQFSLFFNLIQIAANGTSMLLNKVKTGLYGPLILISKETYNAIEGHTGVKSSIVDDVALGKKLTGKGFPFKLFLGGQHISFRMYGGGFKELLEGWTKNYATGAMEAQPLLFILVFLWVTSLTSVSINLIQSIARGNLIYGAVYILLYLLWVGELYRISQNIGNFKKYTLLIFPVYLALFLLVFLISFMKKLLHMKVAWKGRKINLEK